MEPDREAGTLLLVREEIARLVPVADYAPAIEGAFRRLAVGGFSVPAVPHLDGAGGAFHIKAAAERSPAGLAAVKLNGNFPDNPRLHGLPTIQGVIALLDLIRGRMLALMDSIEITARRTAAASQVAARYLARPDAAVLGLVGAGVQARYHLEAMALEFGLREVRCYDLDRERSGAFCQWAGERGLAIQPAGSAAAAVAGADLVVTTTTSREVVVTDEMVGPGTFVAAVGADNPAKLELDPRLLARARVVPDLTAQARVMGDLRRALEAGTLREEQIHGELAEVVAGRVAGRTSPEEIFVFDSTGTAVQDLVAAELAWRRGLADPTVLRLRFN